MQCDVNAHKKSQDFVCFILVLCALVCNTVVLFMPGWWIVQDVNLGLQEEFGVWVIKICSNGTDCEEIYAHYEGETAWMLSTTVMVTMALGCSIIAEALHVYIMVRRDHIKVLRRFSMCVLLAAGSMVFIGVAIFIKKKAGLTPTPMKHTANGEMGWPLGVAVGSGLLYFVGVAVMGTIVCRDKEEFDSIEQFNFYEMTIPRRMKVIRQNSQTARSVDRLKSTEIIP